MEPTSRHHKLELRPIAGIQELRRLILEVRDPAAARPAVGEPLAAAADRTELTELMARAAEHARPLEFDLRSNVPLLGWPLTAAKRFLRRLARTYIDRQSATNDYLLAISVATAREQLRAEAAQRLDHQELAARHEALAALAAELRGATARLDERLEDLDRSSRASRSELGQVAGELERVTRELARAVDAIERTAAQVAGVDQGTRQGLDELRGDLQRGLDAMRERQAAIERARLEAEREWEAAIERARLDAERDREALQRTKEELDSRAATVETGVAGVESGVAAIEAAVAGLATGVARLESGVTAISAVDPAALRRDVDDHGRRLGKVAELFAIANDAFVVAIRNDERPPDTATILGGDSPAREDRSVSVAAELVADWRSNLENEAVYRRHLAAFAGCRHVLDLGCGQGDFLALLQAEGIDGLGVDASAEAIAQCRRRGLRAVESDIFDFLAGPRREIDGVFCSHLVEHLPPADVMRLLTAVAGWLEPGRPLVVLTPNAASLFSHLVHFWRDLSHVRFYPVELLERMLAATGFDVEAAGAEPDKIERYWQL